MGYAAFSFDPDVHHLEIDVQKATFRGKLTLTLTVPTAEAIAAFVEDLRHPALAAAKLFVDGYGRLSISVSPHGLTGHFAIKIELAYDANEAKVTLVVDHAQVLEFSYQLRALVEGRVENFILQEF